MQEIYSRALKRASQIVGGADLLGELLQVPMHRLDGWLMGREIPPMGIFLKAVDIISGNETPPREPDAEPPPHAPSESGAVRRAMEAARRASEMHASILSIPPLFPGARKPRSVLAFLQQEFGSSDGRAMVESALDAAVEGTGADMGNIQLATPGGLVIVAQRGFEAPFLQFFSCVTNEGTCGAAKRFADRVVVSDVQSDPIFSGTASAGIMEQARVRACQSTPLVGGSGKVIGVLSTHFERTRQPDAQEFEVLDRIAERTTYWLEGGSA